MFHVTVDIDALSFACVLAGLLLGALGHLLMSRVKLPEPLPLTARPCRGPIED